MITSIISEAQKNHVKSICENRFIGNIGSKASKKFGNLEFDFSQTSSLTQGSKGIRQWPIN